MRRPEPTLGHQIRCEKTETTSFQPIASPLGTGFGAGTSREVGPVQGFHQSIGSRSADRGFCQRRFRKEIVSENRPSVGENPRDGDRCGEKVKKRPATDPAQVDQDDPGRK